MVAATRERVAVEGFDRDLAVRAYSGISHYPEERAEQDERAVAEHLARVTAVLTPLAETPAQQEALARELDLYRGEYLRRFHVVLGAKSRTMSAFVTGGSNFPTRRNEKRLDTERRRIDELTEWQERQLKGMRALLVRLRTPEQAFRAEAEPLLKDIMRCMAIAYAIDEGRADFQYMNRAAFTSSVVDKIRRRLANGEVKLARLCLDEITKMQAGRKKPFLTARSGVWQEVADAEAKLAATASLIAQVADAAVAAEVTGGEELLLEGCGLRLVKNHDLDRFQLCFETRPSQEVTRALKGSGWNWSPMNKAWQRKITANAEAAARRFFEDWQRDLVAG